MTHARTRMTFVALVAAAVMLIAPAANAQPAQTGRAAGVIAAVVQVNDTLNDLRVLNNIGSIEVITVKDSLNNALQNARFLNNITVLQDFLNNNDVDVLNDALNNNNIVISDVVAIEVLSGGDLLIFTR